MLPARSEWASRRAAGARIAGAMRFVVAGVSIRRSRRWKDRRRSPPTPSPSHRAEVDTWLAQPMTWHRHEVTACEDLPRDDEDRFLQAWHR